MKKVFFLLLVGVVIGYIVKTNELIPQTIDQMLPIRFTSHKEVAGASTTALPKDLSGIQKELGKLPVSAIATSSPQVKALLQIIQKLPKDQLKALCQNKCGDIIK